MTENKETPVPQAEGEQQRRKIMKKLRQSWAAFSDWVCSPPPPDEKSWRRFLLALFRIHIIVYQEFNRDRILLRASALTFIVVLSMVPMLALGTAVLKGLGAGGQMRQAAYKFIETLEMTAPLSEAPPSGAGADREIPAAVPPISQQAPEAAGENLDESLTMHLRTVVDKAFDYVDRTNFATLGAFGILGIVIAVVSVLSSIEQAMNVIWQSKSGRPFSRQVMNYLGMMILLPITINVALATMASLQSPSLLAWLQKTLPLAWLGPYLLKMVPIIAFAFTFTLMYKYLPNTRVKILPAAAGAMFGGLSWLLVQALYFQIQIGVSRYNAIYGSFATVPLFLLWIYLGWIIFLVGGEISFAVQTWRREIRTDSQLTPAARLALAFDIVDVTLADFKARKTSDLVGIAHKLRQPDSHVELVLNDLLDHGMLRHTANDAAEGYVPAAPAEALDPAEFIDLVFGSELPRLRGSILAGEALEAAKSALRGKNLNRPVAAKQKPKQKKAAP